MKLFFTDMSGVRFHGGFNKDNLEQHALNVAEMWSFSGLIYSNELACFFCCCFFKRDIIITCKKTLKSLNSFSEELKSAFQPFIVSFLNI